MLNRAYALSKRHIIFNFFKNFLKYFEEKFLRNFLKLSALSTLGNFHTVNSPTATASRKRPCFVRKPPLCINNRLGPQLNTVLKTLS